MPPPGPPPGKQVRYVGGYGPEGVRTCVSAAARHFGWSRRQERAELQRLFLRPLRRQRDCRPTAPTRPVRAAGVARERHACPRKANAPPDDGEGADPDPPPALPQHDEVERQHHPLGGDVHRDWRAQRLADDIALFAAIRKFLDEPTVPGRLLQREGVAE
jgi:hypothetical protein